MTDTKAFPSISVLTTVTGRVLANGGIGGVYEVLNWMTGESVFTHQIPRISREAVPLIIALHPTLAQAVEEAEQVTGENYQHWLDTWLDRYGPEITVPKMSPDDHERIDPLSEAAQYFPPDKIITVKI